MSKRSLGRARQYVQLVWDCFDLLTPPQVDEQVGRNPLSDVWTFQPISNQVAVCKCRLGIKCRDLVNNEFICMDIMIGV